MRSRGYSFAALLFLLLASGLAASVSATAASGRGSAQIDTFYAEPGGQLAPGTEVSFTVEGTRRGAASVRIDGIPKAIPLREVEAGRYQGSYTIRSRDKVAPRATARATLRVRGAVARHELAFGAAASETAGQGAAPLTARIDRFNVDPVGRLEPGAELKFTIHGTPGAKTLVAIEGVTKDLPMREVRSGEYEGAYTIRRADRFPSSVNVVATLEAGGRWVRARLNQPLVGTVQPAELTLQILSHANNAQVASGPTEVRGRTAPGAQVDIQVDAIASVGGFFGVTQQILNQSVRADGNGYFSFTLDPPLTVPGARFEISLKAHTPQASKEMQLVLLQQK